MPAARASRLRRATSTVRFRVTALATLVVGAVLVVTATALVAAQGRTLRAHLDDSLVQRGDDLAALVAADRIPATLAGGGDDRLAQIVGPGGEVVSASPNLEGRPPIAARPEGRLLRTLSGLPVDDDRFRALSLTARAGRGVFVVHVAATTDDLDEAVAALALALAVGVPAVAGVLALLVWWLVGTTLRPVETMRAEVAAISGGDPGRRVRQPSTGDEVARLAGTMNAMLDRVELAAERERRFVADASHELRTPLTRIRTEVEVDLADPRADHAAALRSVLEETSAMQRLVEDLLHLARGDAGAAPARRDPVDLDDVVLREARRARSEHAVPVDTSRVAPVQVRGDRDQLARAVRNLVDNAARHAAAAVTLSVAEDDGAAVVEVADDGPGVPPGQRERVFDRFARLDESRAGRDGGTGLGLAIARAAVERHGGTIRLEQANGTGARFVVRLPVA